MADRDGRRGGRIASLYERQIRRLVPDCDPRQVEALMRLDFATLAQLYGEQFTREARIAAAAVRADPELAEHSARSMGL